MIRGTAVNRIEKIYDHALLILEEVGIDLKHAGAIALVKENGVRTRGERAFFTRDQICRCIDRAPSAFTLRAANPAFDTRIGEGNNRFVSSYGCPTVYEMGASRPATLLDYVRFAKLVHQCDHFSINGGILVQPAEIPAERSHLIMLYAAMRTSDKCLMGTPGPEHRMEEIMEMAAILAGGKAQLENAHRILTIISTISPLVLDETALGSILVSARYKQPLIISPGPAAGTTGPIDLAGNIGLATAEALAAIAVAQMARPGVPVIFGLHCFGADMTTANISIGSPAYALQAKYTAKLARMLNLPSRCGGCNTDALCVSPQSGYESMLSMLTACENKVDLIVHAAGVMDSYAAVSYEKWITDVEIMDMVDYYLKALEVNDDTLNIDLVKEVGPGGHFLTSTDTLKKCRTDSWTPGIGVRGNIDRGMALDLYYRNISTRLRQMLMEYNPPDLDTDLADKLTGFMKARGVPETILTQIDTYITQNEETLL